MDCQLFLYYCRIPYLFVKCAFLIFIELLQYYDFLFKTKFENKLVIIFVFSDATVLPRSFVVVVVVLLLLFCFLCMYFLAMY